jgi:hypothetical protein
VLFLTSSRFGEWQPLSDWWVAGLQATLVWLSLNPLLPADCGVHHIVLHNLGWSQDPTILSSVACESLYASTVVCHVSIIAIIHSLSRRSPLLASQFASIVAFKLPILISLDSLVIRLKHHLVNFFLTFHIASFRDGFTTLSVDSSSPPSRTVHNGPHNRGHSRVRGRMAIDNSDASVLSVSAWAGYKYVRWRKVTLR